MQIMVTFRTIIFIFFLAALKLNSQTYITTGEVTGDWDLSGSPYIVEGDLTIAPEERLCIKPGVDVLFSGDYTFEIIGRLDANGTTDQNITFTLQDTTGFASGTNEGWGGLAFSGYSSITNDNSILDHCVIEYSGGNGISCGDYSNILITNSTIRNNKNKGIGFYDSSDGVVENINIYNNQQGGIDVVFSSPQVSNFVIENNSGAGISVMGNSWGNISSVFEHGVISNNHNLSNGGGLYLGTDFSSTIRDVEIYSNSAHFGGAIFCGSGFLIMENSSVYFNIAEQGGAFYCDNFATIVLDRSVVYDNNSISDGGAFYIKEAELNLENVTVSNNTAGNQGGALFYDVFFNDPGTITNTILWDNYPQEVYIENGNPQINYSNIKGGYVGENNIDADPLFEDADNGNYHLSWENYPVESIYKSPCIDAGAPHLTIDPDGTIADIGAYYFHQETIYITNTVESEHHHNLAVYPNPTSDSFTVKMSGINQIWISNLSGQIVKQLNAIDINSKINIQDLDSGVYIVMVELSDGSMATEKLIKE